MGVRVARHTGIDATNLLAHSFAHSRSCIRNEPWPDLLVLSGCEWHLLLHQNLTNYAEGMRELHHVLRHVVSRVVCITA